MSRPWIDVRVSLASLTPGFVGRRVRMMLPVALATPLVGSCGEGSVQIVDPARGFEVEYPEGWFLASESVTPHAGVGPDLFAVGTFVLRPDESRCAHMPVGALDDLGPTDAFVAVKERIGPQQLGSLGTAHGDPFRHSTGSILEPASSSVPMSPSARTSVSCGWCRSLRVGVVLLSSSQLAGRHQMIESPKLERCSTASQS